MGGYVGAHMARAGEDVTFVDVWPEHVESMRRHGLHLSGVTAEENFSLKVSAVHVGDVQGFAKQPPFQIAFLALKSYDTLWATTMIKPYLAPGGFIVSLQNGINEEQIAGIVGWGRTLGAVALHLGTELYEPGRVRRTIHAGGASHTVFRIGEVHGRPTQRAEEVARLLRLSDSAKLTANLWGERWSKLTIDASIFGLACVTGLGGSQRGYDEVTRWVRIRLASEAVRVGQALGYRLEEIHKMKPETIARAGEGDRDALAEYTARMIEDSKRRTEGNVPSSAQDILKGRRSEADFVNGYVAMKGNEAGVPAPLNAKMYELVKRVERRELSPSMDNVRDF